VGAAEREGVDVVFVGVVFAVDVVVLVVVRVVQGVPSLTVRR